MSTLTLAKAKEILKKHTTEDHLFTHAAAVSAAMGAMASIFGGDKDHWEAIGYLHDVDYEAFPHEHCHHVREFLKPEGVDEEDIKTIISHGWGLCSHEVEPTTDIEKSLFTVDELTGHGVCTHASRRHQRHGAQRSQEKIQGQEICSWLQPRCDQAGLCHARHGSGRGHAGLHRWHDRT